MKKIGKNIDYRGYNIRWNVTEVSLLSFLVSCFYAILGRKYLGYFTGIGMYDLEIIQTIPTSPKFLKKYFLKRTLIHELGHVDTHIDFCIGDSKNCQKYHDKYDKFTRHGKLQYKYKQYQSEKDCFKYEI